MKKLFGLGLMLILTTAVLLTGCAGGVTSTTPISTTPSITPISQTGDSQLAEDAIKNSRTFKFDGIAGSIKFIKATDQSPISSFRASVYTFEFQTAHPGHGDRSGQMLAQVITTHNAEVYVDQDLHKVKMAFCDGKWDLINDKVLPVSVSGIVLSGGDITPVGLMDAPRRFVYNVKQTDGTIVNVSYTAYPPSPAGDATKAKIFLEFYAGSIQIGDQIHATGMLDQATNTIVVADEGGYIRTAIPKMEVTGKVLSGGDTTPQGLFDAPRRFVYQIQQADGVIINVGYSAYPPSPAGNIANQKITISTYNSGILPGDYLRAYGTYDLATETVIVADEGDFLKTYPVQP